MKFPTYEEMAQNVAEKALDEYEYNGKTLRQWIEIILATASEDKISGRAAVNAMDLYCENTCPIRENMWCSDCQIEELKKIVLGSATDINVATKDGTNLAEVGTDCISRQAAIDTVRTVIGDNRSISICEAIKQLPPIQPKRGRWILDRSGAYCCSECMEPCASYVMMKPRDKFCKMCGSRNEVTE